MGMGLKPKAVIWKIKLWNCSWHTGERWIMNEKKQRSNDSQPSSSQWLKAKVIPIDHSPRPSQWLTDQCHLIGKFFQTFTTWRRANTSFKSFQNKKKAK